MAILSLQPNREVASIIWIPGPGHEQSQHNDNRWQAMKRRHKDARTTAITTANNSNYICQKAANLSVQKNGIILI